MMCALCLSSLAAYSLADLSQQVLLQNRGIIVAVVATWVQLLGLLKRVGSQCSIWRWGGGSRAEAPEMEETRQTFQT